LKKKNILALNNILATPSFYPNTFSVQDQQFYFIQTD
jgi:hypothetical protein